MYRRHPMWGEALLSACAAAAVAAMLVWLGPPGSDLAAHAYQRTLFLQHGFTLLNNFWYAGRYSFITYSVIYYPLAAFFGIKLLAIATIALAALAFALVVWQEWGSTTRWSSRTFAVVWAGVVLSAAFPFALGMALALLALWALQKRARWQFTALAVLTLAASPVAFVLLVIVLAGVALARRAAVPRNWGAVATIAVATGVELVLWRLFPGGGNYPYSFAELAAGVVFCVLGLLFTWRIESARVPQFVFGVYLAAVVGAYVVPSALGENVARMRYAAIPLAVLILSLRRWRPLLPGLAVIALAVSWNLTPLVYNFVHGSADATAAASTWPPAIAFLKENAAPQYRVEAVDTTGHWAAAYLADADIPLARGFFRQDDFPENKVLYSQLGPRAYLAWLHKLGVGYVLMPKNASLDYSSKAEAQIVRSGRAHLVPVFHTPKLVIYKVPDARPIITGPGSPAIVTMTESKIAAFVTRGGEYRIAVRWSPYWRASMGCLSKGKDGMLRLTTLHTRLVKLTFVVSADSAFDTLAGAKPSCALPG
ncbi:MAG: hypothetical protein ACRDL2_07960 [Gaiellaceae bacterium]